MVSLLIVDDHPNFSPGPREGLGEERDLVVMGTSNGAEALNLIDRVRFDLVILDLLEINGLELLRNIKSQHESVQVLVVGDKSDGQYEANMLKEGAAGFVPKETVQEQLMDKIHQILGDNKQIDRDTGDLLAEHLDHQNNPPPHEKLSDREFQILCMFGEGKSVRQIAEELELGMPTISTYRARILDKMDMRTTAELAEYAKRIPAPK